MGIKNDVEKTSSNEMGWRYHIMFWFVDCWLSQRNILLRQHRDNIRFIHYIHIWRDSFSFNLDQRQISSNYYNHHSRILFQKIINFQWKPVCCMLYAACFVRNTIKLAIWCFMFNVPHMNDVLRSKVCHSFAFDFIQLT